MLGSFLFQFDVHFAYPLESYFFVGVIGLIALSGMILLKECSGF
jgi:hypothetical protein